MASQRDLRRARLTREDWVRAAVRLGARVGFENLQVEPLAVEIGATKGSFYWHFTDRGDLLEAVLQHWEQRATADVIAAVESVADATPEESMERLLGMVFSHPENDASEWRILLAADHPVIGPVVARVHEARIGYVARLLQARGLQADRARTRARLAYAGYLGNLLLSQAPGAAVDVGELRKEFVALVSAPTTPSA